MKQYILFLKLLLCTFFLCFSKYVDSTDFYFPHEMYLSQHLTNSQERNTLDSWSCGQFGQNIGRIPFLGGGFFFFLGIRLFVCLSFKVLL